MSLTLHLPPDLERRLAQEAGREGVSPGEYAARLLAERLPPKDRRTELAALIQTWTDEDEEEQRETGEHLIRALDENRLSDRPLFPPRLKGVTW